MFRTVLATVLVVSWVVPPAPAHAIDDLTRSFAYCAGRYSAEMEHAWLMNDPVAEDREARRADFISLLEAVAEPGHGPEILNYRITAKAAQAALLSSATFSTTEEMRNRFEAVAKTHLSRCSRFLLQG